MDRWSFNRKLTQAHNIDHQDPMLERDQLEIDGLNRRPQHPVRLQALEIALLELRLGIRPFHDRHTREKHKKIGGGEDCLIRCHSSRNGQIVVGQIDLLL